MLILITAIAIAMGVSFLCSVMEAALLSLNPGKLARLIKQRPKSGKICAELKNNIEKPIAVILILNTAAHTFGAAIAGAQFDKLYGSDYIWLFSLIFTILMVQYTEILPKALGVRFNSLVMAYMAGILKCSIKIMQPIIWLVHFINRPFEGPKENRESAAEVTLEELDALASMAREAEHITPVQEHAIHEIPDLQDDKVSELMIPVEKIISVAQDMSRTEILDIMRNNLHSRYPVRQSRTSAEFIGVIAIHQLLFNTSENWQTLIRPIGSISAEQKQLHIAENIDALDSKLLLVNSRTGKNIGMLTTHDLVIKLFPHEKR